MPIRAGNLVRSGGISGVALLIVGAMSGGFATPSRAQANSRFLVLNGVPSSTYSVTRNDVTRYLVPSSETGTVDFTTVISAGDILAISADSSWNSQPPTPPLVVEAVQEGIGCLRVTWLPSGDPAVTGYVVNYGRKTVGAGGTYEYAVDVGNTATFETGGLQLGSWYVAVQAKTHSGLLSAYSEQLTVVIIPTATVGVPIQDVELLQNTPNPFNPATRITYLLPETETVRLVVYDVGGREVVVLADGLRTAGRHDILWDGRNRTGERVSTGVYYYRLQVNEKSIVRNMILLK